MKALVICWAWPPDRGFRAQGVDRRLGLFVGAIADLCTKIEMLHLVPERVIPAIGTRTALPASIQSIGIAKSRSR